jgi:hypothetical protein
MQIPAKFRGRTRKSARLGRYCLAQAAAESTMLGGLSSTTTIKAGSTLGSALSHNIKQFARARSATNFAVGQRRK